MLIFVASALAGPPSPEVLDDLDRWHAGADRLIDGPEGCWVFEGEAKQILAIHQAPDRFSTADTRRVESHGPFVARLEDRVWTKIDFRRESSGGDDELAVDLRPLVARTADGVVSDGMSISLDGDGAQVAGGIDEGMNLLREAIEQWTASVETRFAAWDANTEAVRYVREVAVSEGRSDVVTVTSWFPEGGAEANRIDAVWPKLVKLGKWPLRVTLRDPQMHVKGFVHEGRVLPNAESVSLVVGVLGFTVGYEQQIRYLTATPCAAGEQEP